MAIDVTITLGGDIVGNLTEDGPLTTSGHITVKDSLGNSGFLNPVTVNTLGTFTMFRNGDWTYELQPGANGMGSSLIQSLNSGQTFNPGALGFAFTVATNTSFRLSVLIHGVNDAPVITSNGGGNTAAINYAENGVGPVTTVTSSDIDGPARTYSISGTDAALFDIDSGTGALTFKASPDFETRADANGDGVYELTVVASDGSLSDSQALSITVTDVPEALRLIGDENANSLLGGDLNDVIYGEGGDDRLGGWLGDDTIYGGAGRDAISGGAGNDLISGGLDQDTLIGGAGNDVFYFDVSGTTHDLVKDFTVGEDRIAISVDAFAALADYGLGTMDVGELAYGTKATTSDQHLIYNQSKGHLLYDVDGKGGEAAVIIAAFTNKPAIEAGDIILY